MRLLSTSEDECKWFFTTIWFILLKQTIKVRHWFTFTHLLLLYTTEQQSLFHNVTYSVHDESLMSHLAHLVVLLVPPWTSCLIHCCRTTAYLAHHWAGLVLPPAPLPMVTPFPSGSTHSLISPSTTIIMVFHWLIRKVIGMRVIFTVVVIGCYSTYIVYSGWVHCSDGCWMY